MRIANNRALPSNIWFGNVPDCSAKIQSRLWCGRHSDRYGLPVYVNRNFSALSDGSYHENLVLPDFALLTVLYWNGWATHYSSVPTEVLLGWKDPVQMVRGRGERQTWNPWHTQHRECYTQKDQVWSLSMYRIGFICFQWVYLNPHPSGLFAEWSS